MVVVVCCVTSLIEKLAFSKDHTDVMVTLWPTQSHIVSIRVRSSVCNLSLRSILYGIAPAVIAFA